MIARWLALATLLVVVASCGALYLHDEGRLKTAQEALALAEAIRAEESSAFGAMEANLVAVQETLDRLDAEEHALRWKTFLERLGNMDRDALAEEILAARETREEAKAFLAAQLQVAAQSVADTLQREDKIQTDLAAEDAGLEGLLAGIDERLERVDAVLGKLSKAAGQLGADGLMANLGAAEGSVKGIQGDVAGVITGVQADADVAAAKGLLVRSADEILLLERKRLSEYRRHLEALQDIAVECGRRYAWSEIQVLGPLVVRINPAELRRTIEEEQREIAADNGLPPEERAESLADLAAQLEELEANAWDPGAEATFSSYIAAQLAPDRSPEQRAAAAKIPARVGLAIGEDEPYFERVQLTVAAELHRHSIRISEIHADGRMDLVGQLVSALEIYHRGGFKPEEMAEILFLAGVLAVADD